jgi:hypothetical protein
MPDTHLEDRVGMLEEQMRNVIEKIQASSSRVGGQKDWRKSLGMFDEHPIMKQIDEEGQRIREIDRGQASDDYS